MKRRNLLIFIEKAEQGPVLPEFGLQIAKALDHRAILVDVERLHTDLGQGPIEKVGFLGAEADVMETVKAQARKSMQNLRDRAREHWPHTFVDVEVGFPVTEVERISEEMKASMVVIQRPEEAGPFSRWFGSLSTDFVKALDCPVFVLPSDYAWKKPGRLTYLLDADDDLNDFSVVRQFIEHFDTDLLLLLTPEEVMPEKNPVMLKKLKELQMLFSPGTVKYKTLSEKQTQNITKISRTEMVDWIVLRRYGSGFWDRITGNDLSREMVLQADQPVLVI